MAQPPSILSVINWQSQRDLLSTRKLVSFLSFHTQNAIEELNYMHNLRVGMWMCCSYAKSKKTCNQAPRTETKMEKTKVKTRRRTRTSGSHEGNKLMVTFLDADCFTIIIHSMNGKSIISLHWFSMMDNHIMFHIFHDHHIIFHIIDKKFPRKERFSNVFQLRMDWLQEIKLGACSWRRSWTPKKMKGVMVYIYIITLITYIYTCVCMCMYISILFEGISIFCSSTRLAWFLCMSGFLDPTWHPTRRCRCHVSPDE